MRTIFIVVCALIGHRWAPAEEAPDSFAAEAVLECKRCGSHQSLTAETRSLHDAKMQARMSARTRGRGF